RQLCQTAAKASSLESPTASAARRPSDGRSSGWVMRTSTSLNHSVSAIAAVKIVVRRSVLCGKESRNLRSCSQSYAASYWVGDISLNSGRDLNSARARESSCLGNSSSHRRAAFSTGLGGTGTKVPHKCLQVLLIQATTDGRLLVQVRQLLHRWIIEDASHELKLCL